MRVRIFTPSSTIYKAATATSDKYKTECLARLSSADPNLVSESKTYKRLGFKSSTIIVVPRGRYKKTDVPVPIERIMKTVSV